MIQTLKEKISLKMQLSYDEDFMFDEGKIKGIHNNVIEEIQ